MKATMLMTIGLLCLAGCATESKRVTAGSDAAQDPSQAEAADPGPAAHSEAQPATANGGSRAKADADEAAEPAGPAIGGGDQKPKDVSTTGHTVKPSAPVEVTCQTGDDAVQLTVRFLRSARDVDIHVWGTDGLEVRGEARPIQGNAYERGDTVEVDVPFAAPDNVRSYLAIRVSGRFTGRTLGKVHACAVHPEFPDQDNAGADIRVDDQGRKIRVVHPD